MNVKGIETNTKDIIFSVRDTQIHKGIAVLLLLGIHTFVRSNYELYMYWFTVEGKPLLNWLMYNEKVCVSIFVILSGYGLNESFKRRYIIKTEYWKNAVLFAGKHYLKMMINFWVIFLSFAMIGFATHKITFEGTWGIGGSGILSFLIDGMGLQDLITDFWKTPTLNPTWWFMPTIILCYLFFPILKRLSMKNAYIMFIIWMIITVYSPVANHRQFKTGWIFYFAYFCLGIFFSEKEIFNKIKRWKIKRITGILTSIVLVVFTFFMRLQNKYLWDWTHTLAIMYFVEMVIVRNKKKGSFINLFLNFIGKHSSNIFMMHTFFIVIYWQSIIYALKYPLLIYLTALICSVLTSILIEKMKSILGIKRLQARF